MLRHLSLVLLAALLCTDLVAAADPIIFSVFGNGNLGMGREACPALT